MSEAFRLTQTQFAGYAMHWLQGFSSSLDCEQPRFFLSVDEHEANVWKMGYLSPRFGKDIFSVPPFFIASRLMEQEQTRVFWGCSRTRHFNLKVLRERLELRISFQSNHRFIYNNQLMINNIVWIKSCVQNTCETRNDIHDHENYFCMGVRLT